AFLVGLAAPVAADPIPYFARTGETREADAANRPGDALDKSVRQSLTTLSLEGRWGDLPQFGRDLFQAGSPAFTPSETGPVDPDYVLGPGDEITVYVSGYSDTSYALQLDRDGKVFLPRVGSTPLWGLS